LVANRLSIRGWSKEKAARRRREKRGGNFTLSQFLLGPSSRVQTLPAGACPQAKGFLVKDTENTSFILTEKNRAL